MKRPNRDGNPKRRSSRGPVIQRHRPGRRMVLEFPQKGTNPVSRPRVGRRTSHYLRNYRHAVSHDLSSPRRLPRSDLHHLYQPRKPNRNLSVRHQDGRRFSDRQPLRRRRHPASTRRSYDPFPLGRRQPVPFLLPNSRLRRLRNGGSFRLHDRRSHPAMGRDHPQRQRPLGEHAMADLHGRHRRIRLDHCGIRLPPRPSHDRPHRRHRSPPAHR